MKYIFLFLLASPIFWLSCDKEKKILIRGFVFNAKTEEPIDSAYVYFSLAQKNMYGGPAYSLYTNEFGNFEVMLDEGERLIGLSVYQKQHLPAIGYTTIWSQVSEYEYKYQFPMYPLDGALQITFKNTLPISRKVYLRTATESLIENYYGDFQQFYFNFPKEAYPFEVDATSTDTLQVAYPSNEMVYVFWDTVPIPNAQQAANRDSFFLATGGTLTYKVEL